MFCTAQGGLVQCVLLPGMLLNILQCTWQPPTTRSYLAQDTNNAEIERSCCRGKGQRHENQLKGYGKIQGKFDTAWTRVLNVR